MPKKLKIISFLGFNYYQKTIYLHPEAKQEDILTGCDRYETRFIQEALVEFYQPDALYVLLTQKVATQTPSKFDRGKQINLARTNWDKLTEKLSTKKVQLKPIPNIPETGTPANIWFIFNQITECLEDRDHLIIDITHAFRFLPVVALLVISYLKVVKNVKIEGLLYGAFEAKRANNETPIYDLLPIVELLDWITATDKFLKMGNVQELSELIKTSDRNNLDHQNLADNLNQIALGLHLLRPMNVMTEAVKLPARIAKVASTVSQAIPPFATLLQQVENDYSKYGLNHPDDFQNNGRESFRDGVFTNGWKKKKSPNQ